MHLQKQKSHGKFILLALCISLLVFGLRFIPQQTESTSSINVVSCTESGLFCSGAYDKRAIERTDVHGRGLPLLAYVQSQNLTIDGTTSYSSAAYFRWSALWFDSAVLGVIGLCLAVLIDRLSIVQRRKQS